MDKIMYPVAVACPWCDGSPGDCHGSAEPIVELDVDELYRDHPVAFEAWANRDPGGWDGHDLGWLDRVALAAAYKDPDEAWRLAADAIRATDLITIPGLAMLASDVEARIPHAVTLAIEVIDAARIASRPGIRIDPRIAAAMRADSIAIARLRALASAENISLDGHDAEAAQ